MNFFKLILFDEGKCLLKLFFGKELSVFYREVILFTGELYQFSILLSANLGHFESFMLIILIFVNVS